MKVALGIKEIVIIVALIFVAMALIPILNFMLAGMGLTGTAGAIVAYVPTFVVIAIIVPMIGFGVTNADQ